MKQLIVIVGATASGKTNAAIALAKQFNTEIISADSRQIFNELTIGTAKPTLAQLAEVPHHFINHISIVQDYNAGLFETDALAVIENLFEKHDIVVMTGGSGLYINAVLKGFDPLPEADKEVREQLRKEFELKGIDYLQKLLLEKDAHHYARVDIQNPQRLMRALEVCIVTGKPYSALLQYSAKNKARTFKTKILGLDVKREELYKRIDNRVDDMIIEGLIEEVKNVLPFRNHNALQTVGYRELFDYLDEKISLTEAVALIKKNTRNYAKRQITWFRKLDGVEWVEKI